MSGPAARDQNPQAEACATKTRTLHKRHEECGTGKFNPSPKPGPSANLAFRELSVQVGAGFRDVEDLLGGDSSYRPVNSRPSGRTIFDKRKKFVPFFGW
jgi:hypothetical protein